MTLHLLEATRPRLVPATRTATCRDSAGNLFVADQWGGPNNSRIVEFTPEGVGSVFADIFYGGPVNIAIQVPEPSALALLGVGLPALLAFRPRSYKSAG